MIHQIKHILNTKILSPLLTSLYRKNHHFPISHSEPQDVFIAGYPKSGNTWMQNLIAGMLYGIDTNYLPDKLTQELVPAPSKRFYKRILSFTVFKTHDLPQERYHRVIHLIRDGRDALVSHYHFNKNKGLDYALDEMIQSGSGLHYGKWHEHTQAWAKNPYNAEIMLVRYEDLKSDTLGELMKICTFLHINRPENLLKLCVSGNSMESMRKKESEHGFHNSSWDSSNSFFRKGKSGNYMEELSKQQIEDFESQSKEMLIKYGYELSART